MLVSFTVGNYRSFKEPVTLSMEVEPRLQGLEKSNLLSRGDYKHLLNAAAIYGPNASGKSNLIKAVRFMLNFVIHSAKDAQQDEPIDVEPFLLDSGMAAKPSEFEIVFLIGKVEYTYGFKATKEKVIEEWLYYCPRKRKTVLFKRKGKKYPTINKTQFREGLGLPSRTRPNALFLSTVAQWNGKEAGKIFSALKNIRTLQGYDPLSFSHVTTEFMEEKKYADKIKEFIQKLDLNIKDIVIETKGVMLKGIDSTSSDATLHLSIPEESNHIRTIHQSPDGSRVPLKMDIHESHGTQKLFALAGPIIEALANGTTIFIDEIDSRLHPSLTIELLKMFQKDKSNKKNSQIIFTTHDSNLLSHRVKLLRRDQIWFTEKKSNESTDLYSLAEFGPRKDEALDLNYLRGKYGAVPFINELATMIEKKHG